MALGMAVEVAQEATKAVAVKPPGKAELIRKLAGLTAQTCCTFRPSTLSSAQLCSVGCVHVARIQ